VTLPKLLLATVTWGLALVLAIRRRRGDLPAPAFARASLWLLLPALFALWLSLPAPRP
jgi:hypothetical protein